MLKFIAVQLVDDEDVKGMIVVFRQHEVLTCIEFQTFSFIHFSPRTLNQYLMNPNIIEIPNPMFHIHLMQPHRILMPICTKRHSI